MIKTASVLSSNSTRGDQNRSNSHKARAEDDGHLKHDISGGGDTVAKIIKSNELQVAGASSGNESTVRLGVASVCLRCHRRWLHNSHHRPPASLGPLRLCLSRGASLLTPPTPAGTFTFSHVLAKKKRRRWNPSPGALQISGGMICTCGAAVSSARVICCRSFYIYTQPQ